MTDRRQQAVLWFFGLSVVLLLWVAVLLRPSEPIPCVDYIPATFTCTPDSPAVLNGK